MNDKKTKNSGNSVRDANLFVTWKSVFDNYPITVDGIADVSGLSRPTVLSMLDILLDMRIIQRSGFAKSSGGRQAVLYSPTNDAFYSVGIDMDFPVFHLNISDFTGKSVYSFSETTDALIKPDDIADKIVAMIGDSIKAAGISPEKLIGCGIGFPGSVDRVTDTALRSPRLLGWRNVPLGKIITERTGLECCVRNSAHFLGLAEKKRLGSETENMIYFMNSCSIGMSVFLNGRLWEGATGNSGSVSHISIDRNGLACKCGRNGCAELYCSKTAIEKEYAKIRWSSSQSCAPYDKIIRLADEFDDDVSRKILVEAGKTYGELISSAVRMFDIPYIVLGGIGCDENSIFFKTIAESVAFNCQSAFGYDPKVLLSKLDSSEYGMGACIYITERFCTNPERIFGKPIHKKTSEWHL